MSTAGPRFHRFACPRPEGERSMAYVEWGSPSSDRLALCVHGLTRNGRDFDQLAQGLVAAGYRVICPDVLGRGQSQWLDDPLGYNNFLYAGDIGALLTTVLAKSPTARVDWIGTSMGGIIGMIVASSQNSPVTRLVLNDIGAVIPYQALRRIGEYLGQSPSFDSVAEVAAALRHVHAGFGDLTDAQWHHMAEHGHRRQSDGRFALAYDPAIRLVFEQSVAAMDGSDMALWQGWEAITAPVLLVRGAQSDLLRDETAREMQTRGPACTLYEVAGAGHAPALMADDQIKTVVDWLSA